MALFSESVSKKEQGKIMGGSGQLSSSSFFLVGILFGFC
jgi:hypothetical protein